MMVKSGLVFFYFEILLAPSELLLPSAKKNLPRKAELAWQVSRYLWRGSCWEYPFHECIEYLIYVTLPAMSINCIFGLQWPHDRLILMAVSFLSPVNIQTLKIRKVRIMKVCTLCLILLRRFVFLWCKMPMFQRAGMKEGDNPTSMSIFDSYDMKTLWLSFGSDIFTAFKMPTF